MSLASNARFDELKATDRLPSPTGVGLEILRLTQSEETTIQELSRTIQTDPAMAGRILKLVNSAQFTAGRAVVSLDDAVVRLGFSTVRNVALGFSLLSAQRDGECAGFDYEKYWAHSLAAAIASQMISSHSRAGTAMDGYTCGLLSRIGSLALACVYPEEYTKILTTVADERPDELISLEQEQFATDHNELGAAMLLDWGLPNIFAVAIQHCEQPESSRLSGDFRDMRLTRQIHIANLVARICIAGKDRRSDLVSELQTAGGELELDDKKLAELCEQVEAQWRESAKTLGLATEFAVPDGAPSDTDPERERGIADESPSVASRVSASVERTVPERQGRCAKQAKADCQNQPPSSGSDAGPDTPIGDPQDCLRILVVEDEAISRRRLEKILSRSGHAVTTAADGREGLRLALETKPQMVITDWMMPEMDGLAFCRALRRSDAGRQMYVIILTSCGDDSSVQAFEAGADDYVVKPFCPDLLQGRLRAGLRVIRLQEESARDKEKIDRHVAELAVANRMLQKSAQTDALTGLSNRRYFMDRLAAEWAEANRHERPLACLMLDIDHFKQVNDTYGHDIGNEVLRDMAQVLKKSVRRYDVPSRSGGEEFIVICPRADLQAARDVAERIRAAVERNTVAAADGPELRITVSIGAADNTNVPDADALVKAADHAMYAAKKSGRNRVCVAASPTAQTLLHTQADKLACVPS